MMRCLHENLYTNVYGNTLVKIAKRWKQPYIHDRGMKQQNVVYYPMAYYSAIKQNKVLLHAATWRNLENWKHGAKWKKLDTKRVHIVWFHV